MKNYLEPIIKTIEVNVEDIILVSIVDEVLDWKSDTKVDEEL